MKNCISRRSFLKAAGILGAAGALAACGGSSSTSTAASSTASSAAASTASTGASIKLWTYPIGGWGNDDTVQNLISSFNAKYPDIKVTVEYLDYTNGDDQVNTAIEGGSAPDLVMEGPERLVANWGAKGVMAPLNDLWTDDAKKDIYASVESACHNEKGDYYEYPLCMTAHCMAVNMTKVKEVGADQYIDTYKHTWSTDGFLKTVDALYNGGYENVAVIESTCKSTCNWFCRCFCFCMIFQLSEELSSANSPGMPHRAAMPTSVNTMRDQMDALPPSSQPTKSNWNRPTRPQLMPPTINRIRQIL